jgi:O-antigen biosynthesis protein
VKRVKLVVTGLRVLRDEGLRSFSARVLRRMRARIEGNTFVLPVKTDDAMRADWSNPPAVLADPIFVESGPVTIAWVMSPPSLNSGGHQNLLRFIDYAERAGHRCLIYFYTNTPVVVNSKDMRAMLRSSAAYPDLKASMEMYDSKAGVDPSVQAIFATGWETAYPVFLDPSRAKRFYFVQDFEPYFYPVGSESILAENTYRFGFHGITAGGWLSTKLHDEYGMKTDHFDFAVDKTHYSLVNRGERREVFFYARPVTPRRGFELGIMALQDFARKRPEITINLAGWDVSTWDIPFAHNNLAGLDISELNEIYNRCAAGLVISGTNMSLLPLELMSSGVAPVLNDAPNNRLVSNNPYIEYVPTAPSAISARLIEILDRPDAVARSEAMSKSVLRVDWDDSGRQFIESFERAMRA